MKNKSNFIKIYGLISILLIAAYLLSILYLPGNLKEHKLNLVQVNDLVKTTEENWNSSEGISAQERKQIFKNVFLNMKDCSLNYTITTLDGDVLYKTTNSNYSALNESVVNRDTMIDIVVDNEITGKVIIENDTYLDLNRNQKKLERISIFFAVIIAGIEVIYLILLYIYIIKPFRLMKNFATAVAMGNYDLPLKMDRDNLFGAFTESFDIMREELMISKERERALARSKKELVASLSHDIKTPIASIKAVSELMLAQGKDDKTNAQINIISTKAEQIELLINNLFHSTLEEMTELKVSNSDENSNIITNMIKTSDFYKKVRNFTIPPCLISCDKLRLQQVFDNIINNSYKYADTDIVVESEIIDKTLKIAIKDFGTSCKDEELPLLCEKFYRGSNTSEKNGYGLGLYISKYFMEKMNGKLELQRTENEFIVTLTICMP